MCAIIVVASMGPLNESLTHFAASCVSLQLLIRYLVPPQAGHVTLQQENYIHSHYSKGIKMCGTKTGRGIIA
jgi:hypothetical protein